jgi:flagellar hook-basal body complex protein FliE
VIPPIAGAIGPLGPSEWTVSPVGGLGAPAPAAAIPTGSGSFGNVLSNAIDSLEQSQAGAAQAAQQLATGQLADPTQAVTAAENASLQMDLAAQLRNKLTEVTNTIFQTQI